MLSVDDRPALSKSVSDGNLRVDGEVQDDRTGGQPDLNSEVATLSTKLINAINHQTKLDDSLTATRHELQQAKARIAQLEATTKEHERLRSKGLLVEKKIMDSKVQDLTKRLKEEGAQRGKAEKDKRNIEQELENLTTALFDEANKMVSAARKERDAVDRKNDQLRSQLRDTESLLASNQEQLAELKRVIQQMTAEREQNDAATASTPSTPALGNRTSKESLGRVLDSLNLTPNAAGVDEFPPCPPTTLTGLLQPVLRHDIAAYHDFCELLHAPKWTIKSSPMTRLSSGSLTGIQVMGIGISMASPNQSPNPSPSGGFFSRKQSDAASVHSPSGSLDSATNAQLVAQGLKDTKFYKRTLTEDIEPTLRLDCAPGISWYARRGVMSSVVDGSLVIEPTPTTLISSMMPCAMCGETRRDEKHLRTHRMRANENKDSQIHTLCLFCVNRLRSVCDFLAFLRTLREGHWKCETENDEKHAWEESVKLRERMFWSRIGGGVVPAFIQKDSMRTSLGDVEEERALTETPPRTPELNGIQDIGKLDIPKKRNSRGNPLLTQQKNVVTKHELPPTPTETPTGLNIIAEAENECKGTGTQEIETSASAGRSENLDDTRAGTEPVEVQDPSADNAVYDEKDSKNDVEVETVEKETGEMGLQKLEALEASETQEIPEVVISKAETFGYRQERDQANVKPFLSNPSETTGDRKEGASLPMTTSEDVLHERPTTPTYHAPGGW